MARQIDSFAPEKRIFSGFKVFLILSRLKPELDEFRQRYKEQCLLSRYGYVSPSAQHRGLLVNFAEAA
jgi:hypothetical protein